MRRFGLYDLDCEKLNGDAGVESEGKKITLRDYLPRQITRLNPDESMAHLDRHSDEIALLHEYLKRNFGIECGDINSFIEVKENGDTTITELILNDEEIIKSIRDRFEGWILDPFIQHTLNQQVAEKCGLVTVTTADKTDQFNDKVRFCELAQAAGVAVPETSLAFNIDDVENYLQAKSASWTGVFKKSRGASGLGMDFGNPEHLLSYYKGMLPDEKNSGVVMQDLINVIASPSSQFETFIDGTYDVHNGLQLLERDPELPSYLPPSIHLGNALIRGMENTKMWEYTKIIAELCIAMEAYGPAGVDYMVDDLMRTTSAEVNHRVTGGYQYIHLFAKLVKQGIINSRSIWVGMNMQKGNEYLLSDIVKVLESDRFNPNVGGVGIIPTNFCYDGKIMGMAVAESHEDAFRVVTEFEGFISGIDNSDRNEEFLNNVTEFQALVTEGLI